MQENRDFLKDLNNLTQLQPDAAASQRAIERAQSALDALPPVVTVQPATMQSWSRRVCRPSYLIPLTAAALIIVFTAGWLLLQSNSSIAFGQVQEEVAKTKSVQFSQTTRQFADNQVVYEDAGQTMILGADLSREEYQVQKQPEAEEPLRKKHFTMIMDSATKKFLYLYPDEKTFRLLTANGLIPGNDLYRKFREVPAARTEKLPEKVIDGKTVVGFVLRETIDNLDRFDHKTQWAESTTYWVDVTTKLPVRIEYTGRNNDPDAHASYETVRTNFVFDALLDASLFSTDPPQDYTDLVAATEGNLRPKLVDGKKTEFVFADVQEEVAKTKTVQYTTSEKRTINNHVVPELITHTMILGPHLKRDELTLKDPEQLQEARRWAIEPSITIHNVATGQYLILDPALKTFGTLNGVFTPAGVPPPDKKQVEAEVKKMKDRLKDPQVDFYDEIRRFPENKSTKLPEQTIDEKRVVGFQLEQKVQHGADTNSLKRTYWVDVDTKLPVRIDAVLRDTNPMGINSDFVMRDFVFDAPLDESLFSFTPPDGYTELGKPAEKH